MSNPDRLKLSNTTLCVTSVSSIEPTLSPAGLPEVVRSKRTGSIVSNSTDMVARALPPAYPNSSAELVSDPFEAPMEPPVVANAVTCPRLQLTLTGDEGARVLFRRHPAVAVPCDGTGSPDDVDTPEDLTRLELQWRSQTASE